MKYITLVLCLCFAACTDHTKDYTVADPVVDPPPPVVAITHAEAVAKANGPQPWDGNWLQISVIGDHCHVLQHWPSGNNAIYVAPTNIGIKHSNYAWFTIIPDYGYEVAGFEGTLTSEGADFTCYGDGPHTITVVLLQRTNG